VLQPDVNELENYTADARATGLRSVYEMAGKPPDSTWLTGKDEKVLEVEIKLVFMDRKI
jgi:hypothetical protein